MKKIPGRPSLWSVILIPVMVIVLFGLSSYLVHAASTITLDFSSGTLPFPDFHNMTDEFKSKGIVFSPEDSDLPQEFQKSLGLQENIMISGHFYNLFRATFTSPDPVESVSVTFRDSCENPQKHTLTAFDTAGNIVGSDSFTEHGFYTTPFTLTVSGNKSIAFIVAIEEPYGAEELLSIAYTTGDHMSAVPGLTTWGISILIAGFGMFLIWKMRKKQAA
jgi:hypothetical protein